MQHVVAEYALEPVPQMCLICANCVRPDEVGTVLWQVEARLSFYTVWMCIWYV